MILLSPIFSSFCINPVNFFRLFSLPSTFLLRSAFTSSFYQSIILSSSLPSRLFILLYLSIVPVLSYTALLLLPSSSSAISPFFFHPAFRAYPVIISSPFLLVFFYRSAPLPRFSLLYVISRTFQSSLSLPLSCSNLFLFSIFLSFLHPPFIYIFYISLSFYIFSISLFFCLFFNVHTLVRL